MPFYPNENQSECCICLTTQPYYYALPSNRCSETQQGMGMPICIDCFFAHELTRPDAETCPCCGRDMDAAELSRCGEEALSPHDYGIPQDIPESAYSVEFARAHEADAQMEQQAAHEEEEREEQREEEEREEEEREQQEHEHQ